jgi:predicted outer membrane repeat protein
MVIIDCEGSISDPHRGFLFQNGEGPNSVLDGFTIQNGYSNGNGGGILIENASPGIKNCILESNYAALGGGGISCRLNSDPLIENCTLKENTGSIFGGGLSCEGSSPVISDCVFDNNTGQTYGGAIFCSGSSPDISFSLFNNNQTDVLGGAVMLQFSSPAFTNCTFNENKITSATFGKGAALFCGQSTPVLENCLIVNSDGGEVVFCSDDISQPTLLCSNIFGNAGGDWVGCIADQAAENGNISSDPLFCNPLQGDFGISSISPCNPENNDCGVLIGAYDVSCQTTDIEIDDDNLPQHYTLMQNYPNPFNPKTIIGFSLPRTSDVSLEVFNLLGQRVIELIDQSMSPGYHTVVWNGKNDQGRMVSSGVYYYRLRAGEFTESRKMLLLK